MSECESDVSKVLYILKWNGNFQWKSVPKKLKESKVDASLHCTDMVSPRCVSLALRTKWERTLHWTLYLQVKVIKTFTLFQLQLQYMFQVSEMGHLSIAAQNVFSCHDQRSKQAKSETRKIQNPKHPQINSIKIQNSPPIKSLKNSKTQSIPYLRWGKVKRKVCTVGARQTTPAFGEGPSFSLGFWSFGKSRW